MDSPTWLPERDRVVQIWKSEDRTGKKKVGRGKSLSDEKERFGIEDNKYEQDLTRREFSEQERHYILHGDSQTAKREQKIKLKQTSKPNNNSSSNRSNKTKTSTSSSLNPSLTLSSSTHPTPSPPPPQTLKDELAQAGWTSRTPTPPLNYPSPSPSPRIPLNLKERRNATIQPIRTNGIWQQGHSAVNSEKAGQEDGAKSQEQLFNNFAIGYDYDYGYGYGGSRSAPPFRTRGAASAMEMEEPKQTPGSGATTPTPCTPLFAWERGSAWEGRREGGRAVTMSARIGIGGMEG